MASLIVISGEQKGEYLPLGRRTSVIGRAENLPLQILDEAVSRKHLRIRFEESENRYYAEDISSKHGLFVNLRKITNEAVLHEGDQVLIGQTALLFTDKDFDDRESALKHYKKVGEKAKTTRID